MLTKFSKWVLYCASYLPVYAILILRILFSNQEGVQFLKQQIKFNFHQHFELILVLLMLFVLSSIVTYKVRVLKVNERVDSRLTKNTTGEMTSFFIPFILSLLTITMDWYGWLISVFIFLLCGFIVIQADWLHLCPIFIYAGYMLYKDQKNNYILSRLTKERYNQLLINSNSGIEARALTPNLYIIPQNKF